MRKVNIGLFGVLLIILMLFYNNHNFINKIDDITEDVNLLKKMIQDIDYDIHEMEELIEKNKG